MKKKAARARIRTSTVGNDGLSCRADSEFALLLMNEGRGRINSPLHQSRGFTLIEMIIVLVIGVLGFAAISSNISSGNQSTKLQAAARDIASALRYAHGQALMSRQTVSVVINLDDNSYRVSNRDKIYELPTEIDVSLTVAEEELAEGDGGIRFFNDGSSTGGRISLEWGNQRRQIDVNWITGEVTLSAIAPGIAPDFAFMLSNDAAA